MNLKHIILSPGIEPEVKDEPVNYDAIVNAVGYPVEVINIEGGAAVMYVCEEGKQKGLPFNEAATKIARANLRNGDYVSGTAMVLGPIVGGNDSGLSDDTLKDLLAVLA